MFITLYLVKYVRLIMWCTILVAYITFALVWRYLHKILVIIYPLNSKTKLGVVSQYTRAFLRSQRSTSSTILYICCVLFFWLYSHLSLHSSAELSVQSISLHYSMDHWWILKQNWKTLIYPLNLNCQLSIIEFNFEFIPI